VRVLAVAAVFVTFGAAAWGALRAARCNFVYWRRTRRMPLVIASDDELTETRAPWAFKGRKWPDPGVPGAWLLTAKQCRAYARIARDRRQRHGVVNVVSGLLIASAVGFLWPKFGPAWEAQQLAVRASNARVGGDIVWLYRDAFESPALYLWLIPVLAILSVLPAYLTREMGDLEEIYGRAAILQDVPPSAPVLQQSSPVPWWQRFMPPVKAPPS